MERDFPSGQVTLVFTDIEGSTKLLHELGPVAYATALVEHRRLLRDSFGRHGGVEVDTQGDAFFYAFADARERARAQGGTRSVPPAFLSTGATVSEGITARPFKCTNSAV